MTRLILIGTARNFPSAVQRFGITATGGIPHTAHSPDNSHSQGGSALLDTAARSILGLTFFIAGFGMTGGFNG